MKHLMIIAASISLLISCNKKKVSIKEECTNPIEENNPPCDLMHEWGYGFEFGEGDSLTPGANYRYHFTEGDDPNDDVWSLAFMSVPTDEGDYLIVDTLTAENQVVIHKRYTNYYYHSVQSGDYLYLRRDASNQYIMNFSICNFNIKQPGDPGAIFGFTLAKKIEMP